MDASTPQICQAIRESEQDPNNLKGQTLITAAVRKIAREQFQSIRSQPKDAIFDFCEKLLETNRWEERTIAFEWAFRVRKQYTADDFPRFESWLERYVKGWGSCDDFCTHAFGYLIYAFPEHIPNVMAWIPSENRFTMLRFRC